MAYTEVEPKTWEYENDGELIEGVLIDKKFSLGKNNSSLYTLETQPGEFTLVWGSAILDERMTLVKVGDKIKITYKGLGEAKAGQNAPKIFKVEVDRE